MAFSPLRLGVNIDHSATLRQARYQNAPRSHGGMVEPDPLVVALAAERAGADAITLHLREDRRHIQDSDVERIAASIQTRLNFEMAATAAMAEIALSLKPASVLLVPEAREELTTEGGLMLTGRDDLKDFVSRIKDAGIRVRLFVEPHPRQVEAAARLQADSVELHTGAFANGYYEPRLRARHLEALAAAALQASELGLEVHAGHGLNYVNVAELCQLPQIRELNIGHSILARALYVGIEAAVAAIARAYPPPQQSMLEPFSSLPNTLALGVDLVEIKRIEGLRQRHGSNFLKRVFTDKELAYCLKMPRPNVHLAARFAAKEAIAKTFGCGIGETLRWKSISVLKGPSKEPLVLLDARAEKLLKARKASEILLSLTHTDLIACAFAALIASENPLKNLNMHRKSRFITFKLRRDYPIFNQAAKSKFKRNTPTNKTE